MRIVLGVVVLVVVAGWVLTALGRDNDVIGTQLGRR